MKKLIALLLIAMMVTALPACGGGSKPQESVAPTVTDAAGITIPQGVSNTTYDVGDFTVFVPEGWQVYPVPDRNDPTKALTNDIMFAKGEVTYNKDYNEWVSETGQSFYITYLNKEEFAKAPERRSYYAKDYAVTDMEDRTIGSLTWQGFSVSPLGAPVYMIWAASGEGGYYISLSTAYDLSLDDADVQTILGSLK